MKTLLSILIFSATVNLNAQVVLYFDWDQNPVTQAAQGANATAVSSSAKSSNNGVGGSKGLNPGLPKQDINMDIPGSAAFDLDGIDIQIDFQRDESVGDFVTRNGFVFGMNSGYLYVQFRISTGMGSYTTVSSGNVYSIPNDNVFRTYRFFYLPDLGTAELQVNGVNVWSYNGIPGRNLYWTGGNLRIGDNMDGSGSDRTIMDNLVIGNVLASPLPVELTSFAGDQNEDQIALTWSTASETNNSHFTVERSQDGLTFDESYGYVRGAGNSSNAIEYNFTDEYPMDGYNYYRLKQTDYDGKSTTTDMITVYFENSAQVYSHVTGQHEISLLSENITDVRAFTLGGSEVRLSQNGNTVQIDPNASGIILVTIVKTNGKAVSAKISL